ncbi:MAG: SusC/RagA family TonB-linked outer membrane protein [Chitinophagaceae bacterium]
MRKKLLLGFGALLMLCITSFAQTTATGKVVDEKGAAISGATVLEKGTKNGTTTASDGSYTLKVKNGADLLFRAIGFEDLFVSANKAKQVVMKDDSKTLTEVVVTGVGVATSKKKIPIEVASLNIKDAAKSTLGSVEQALMGKIAGAQVQFQSGTPGTGASIILRALNSFGGSYPLILFDGIEVSDLNGIDLATVDRVEVVKGAAGGALYGAQGGNGVIQIFSKRGSSNKKAQISITSQVSSGSIIRPKNSPIAQYHSFQTNAQGFITSSGAQIVADANGAWGNPDFLDASANPSVLNNKVYKEKVYDHLSQAYSNAITTNNSINVNGGGEKSDYAFTLSRYDERNVLSNSYKRTSLGSNVGFELLKGLTLRNNLQAIFTEDNLLSGDPDASIGGTSSGRFALFNSFPYIDFMHRDPNGNLVVSANGGDKTTRNPLSEPEWRIKNTTRTRLIENLNLNYKVNRFVELDYKYGVELNITDGSNMYKNQSGAAQAATSYWGQTLSGSLRNDYDNVTRQNSLATLLLKFDFEKDFKINLPIKSTTQVSYDYRKTKATSYFAQGTVLPTFPPYNISVATNKTSGDYYSTFITFGTLFNQTFDYKDLMGISIGFRSDYSSKFGEGGGSAQNFSRGTFYFRPTELFKIKGLQEWKIRGAFGGAGIQPDGPYDRQTTLSVQQLGNTSTISNQSALSNPALRLQVVKELEIGTDLTFKTNSKKWFPIISTALTVWSHKADDLIRRAPLAITTGAASILDNVAAITSNGIDFSVDATVLQTKNLDWNFSGRLGTTKATVTKLYRGLPSSDGYFNVKENEEIGLFNYMSPLTSIDQLNGNTKVPYIAAADANKYEVVNGMVVDTASKKVMMTSSDDTKNAGSAYPKFTASFTNTFTINKVWTVSFQLDWIYGNKIYNTSRQWLYRDRLSADFDKPVTIGGKTGAYVAYYNSLYNSVSPTTWFVESGSFARLRDLSITYNIPTSVKFLKNSSFTVSGRNLFTITNYSGLDPEATGTADAQGNLAGESGKYAGAVKGIDYFGVPNLKSFQVSLRIGL